MPSSMVNGSLPGQRLQGSRGSGLITRSQGASVCVHILAFEPPSRSQLAMIGWLINRIYEQF